jgi:hypothetical protein
MLWRREREIWPALVKAYFMELCVRVSLPHVECTGAAGRRGAGGILGLKSWPSLSEHWHTGARLRCAMPRVG